MTAETAYHLDERLEKAHYLDEALKPLEEPDEADLKLPPDDSDEDYWYLSGPMTGYLEYHKYGFEQASKDLRERGYNIVSPHELDNPKDIERLDESGDSYSSVYYELLERDLEIIIARRCKGVIVLKDWEQSRGARAEVNAARSLNKPILRYPDLERVEEYPKVPANILEEANKLVGGSRGEAYGHPYHDFSRTAEIVSAILGTKVGAWQIPLIMIAVKLSRQCNERKRDNLVDIAGYARTAEMVDDFESDQKVVEDIQKKIIEWEN